MKVEIYGYDPQFYTCAPCINAKRMCELKKDKFDIDMTFHSVAKGRTESGKPILDTKVTDELCRRLQRSTVMGMTMPQIFVDDESIGGFDKLREVLK
ncbi:putative thioredoxin [Cronobacter phage S13]|uniref:Thioredoxin n=1 Tax=Cronobacter phage LPCS28 TaxID=2924885 RepID=A0AAE9G4S6_9CAUD|nr:putative thioredoxin [Cronobacter phage S13]YP_010665816.1 hypothetical protein PQB73_gp208 [Cronobacter phage LPCS28]AIA65033.1 putative thioredoxin [Cronobacter phage S13]UNY47005.1 hypothetical protein EHEKIMEA_00123 [Cronobacter phage LPCS28]